MSLTAHDKALTEPQSWALADERMSLDWSALDRLLDLAAGALLARDFQPERRVAIFAPNSAETVTAYLAALEAGVSSVPVNYHLTAEELAYILRDSRAEMLFVGPETAGVGLQAAEAAGVSQVVGWRCPPTPGLEPWDAWLQSGEGRPVPSDLRPRAHLHYTSGTTGRPKGAETPPTMFPQAATTLDLFERLREGSALLPPGPVIVVGPLYHTGPLGSVRSLGAGVPVVTLERFDPEKALAAIERHKAARAVMVPTHFQRFLSLPKAVRDRYDVSSLRWLAHTGAACPQAVKRAMIDWFGPVLVEAYGATESGTTNSITSEEWLARPGSVGKTIAPFEPVIVGEDGARLGPGQSGQLYFRDTTGRGIIYHGDPGKTAAAHLEPGVFTLGEIGHVDEDGYVFITDRISDMIVSGGVNIYPAETEQVLIQHPAVADVAVIGAPNAEMGEEVKALIIPADPDHPPSAEALNLHCRERLAGFKCPRSYDMVGDLGRSAMGKINKRELRRPYWPGERTIGG